MKRDEGEHESSGLRALLVDDEVEIRRAIRKLLVWYGWEVVEAASAEEALARASDFRPDLILLDVVLPDRDGFTVCEELRADARFADSTVLIITGITESETRSRCYRAGADDLLFKPLDPAEIKMRLRNISRRKSAEEELKRVKDELELRVAERTQDLKQANQQLMQAQRMEAIGTLAGGIAHDFNNILSPIVGYAELLLEDLPEGESADHARHIRSAAFRARDLVQQILTFSHQKEGERTRLRMQLVVAEVARLLRATLPAHIELRKHIDRRCREVIADPVQVHQLVMNLCTNSYQAMTPHGGTLTIRLEDDSLSTEDSADDPEARPGPHVVLTVSDTGHGIPPEHLDRIFEPYFTTRPPGRGSGLGLAVVHGIVTSCHGRIAVESTVGAGTTFRIWIPAVPAVTVSEEARTSRPAELRSLRVLLVDDEPLLLKVTGSILSRLGHAPVPFNDPTVALEAFEAAPDEFDLVITDYVMRGLNGAELGRRIHEVRSDIPMILSTGFCEHTSMEAMQDFGFAASLKKPFSKQDIVDVLEEAMASVE